MQAGLEALETLKPDGVTAENCLLVLQMIASNYTPERTDLAKTLIGKFEVSDQIVTSLFGRAAVPALLDEVHLRKALKQRQDSLYRQHKYSYSFAQSLGFVELLGLLSAKASWPEFERVIGQYSLDPVYVLGQTLEVLARTTDYTWFGSVFEESPFTHEQLLSSIHWRLENLEDWRPTLEVAAGHVGKLVEFGDVYRMLGPDESFMGAFDLDWEQQLVANSGGSQSNALMAAGILAPEEERRGRGLSSGLGSAGGLVRTANQVPTVRQRAAFAAALGQGGHKELALQMCKKFPLMVQANSQLSDYINSLLLEDIDNRELLQLAGPSIGRSHELMVALSARFNDYEQFRIWLLPAISFASAPTVDVLWDILATFSQEQRYTLYTEWQFSVPRYHKGVKYALKSAEKKAQGILKRISNENVDEMLRQFCELAVANPFSVFTIFLSQVETYDKIGRLILKNPQFNKLGWDMLPLVIMVELSSGRSQQGDSALHHRKWVQALARFTAHLAVGHAQFDVTILLEFILKQFHQNKFDNIVLLRELLVFMGGSIDMNSLSWDQIRALGASRHVQDKARRQLFNDMPSAEVIGRLLDALKRGNLVLEYYLALVYAKRYRVQDAGLAPPKVLGHLYDESHDVLQRYMALIARLDSSEFESFVPAVPVLVDQFKVPLEDAMSMWRPFLAQKTRKSDSTDLHQLAAALPQQSTRFSNALYVAGWMLEPYDLTEYEGYNESDRSARQKHMLMVKKCLNRLAAEQASWLNPPDGARHSQMLEFLTKVVLPRALYSRLDAVFAVDFLFTINKLGVVHFSTLSCLKSLLSAHLLYNTMVGSTPDEAECLGLFVATLFRRLLDSCAVDDGSFEKFQDQQTTEGGATTWTAAQLKQRDENPGTREQVREKLFNRKEVLTAVSQWARKICQMIVDALNKDDFMTVRNAISVLKNGMKQLFRSTNDQLAKVGAAVEALQEDSRADIKLAATAIAVQLKKVKEGVLTYKEQRPRESSGQGEPKRGERSGRKDRPSERQGERQGDSNKPGRERRDRDRDRRERERERGERNGGERGERSDRPDRTGDLLGDRLERSDRRDRERGERPERDRRDRPSDRPSERGDRPSDRSERPGDRSERSERPNDNRSSRRNSASLSAKPELDAANALPSRPTRPPSPSRDDWLVKREHQKKENAGRRRDRNERIGGDRSGDRGDRDRDRDRDTRRRSGAARYGFPSGRKGEYRDRDTPLPPPPRDAKRSRLD